VKVCSKECVIFEKVSVDLEAMALKTISKGNGKMK
jgi:hypothetical protein